MTVIRMNLSAMFSHREPWDCSNSQANLGPNAATWTWGCAREVANDHQDWLVSPLADAVEYIKDWARETGAWDREEIEAWDEIESLALLVQNVASDLRLIGSDDHDLAECAGIYGDTDWDLEPEYPTTHIWCANDSTFNNPVVFGEVCS